MVYNNNEKPSLENVILSAVAEALRNTHTNLIAKITKVNQKTINCKPVISRVVDEKKIDLPEFAEVPILNFLGGSSSIQMPLAVGDYCILFVNERCFDGWYNGQDFEKPLEARVHDYSDSIAFVGIKNKAGELDIPTVITILGDAYQEGNYEHVGNRDQTGDYILTGDQTINGNLQVNGNITCTGTISAANFSGLAGSPLTSDVNIESSSDIKAGAISLTNHTHTSNGTGNETSSAN